MPHKMVNGVKVPLTEAELAELQALEDAHQAKIARNLELEPLKSIYSARLAPIADGGYGKIHEQLEIIAEQGHDAFQAHIAAVKAAHPISAELKTLRDSLNDEEKAYVGLK